MAEASRDLSDQDLAGPAYTELLKERLEAETGRADSLERRASAISTVSGFLTSLLLGLAGFARVGEPSSPDWLPAVFGLAVVLLLAAAGVALVANRIQKQKEIPPREFDRLVNEYWDGSLEVGERRAAQVRVGLYRDLYEKNHQTANRLELSLYLQIAAVVAVGITAFVTLMSRV